MPPKLKTEDIVEAILDAKVVEALAKALAPFITKTIDESLAEKLADLSRDIANVQQANEKLQSKVTELKRVNDDLQQQLTNQHVRLDAMETYSRLDNLIIKGLPEQSYAERGTQESADADASIQMESHVAVESTVISFCRDTLHIDILQSDISTAHRLKKGKKDVVRPVIVKFTNRRIRDAVYRAKKQLKGLQCPIYISEHLTKFSSDLFYESRKLLREKKVKSAWTQNGQVFVKLSNDPNAKPVPIKCRGDLIPING